MDETDPDYQAESLGSSLDVLLVEAQLLKADGDSLLAKMGIIVAVLNVTSLVLLAQSEYPTGSWLPLAFTALSAAASAPVLYPFAAPRVSDPDWIKQWSGHKPPGLIRDRLCRSLIDCCERIRAQNERLGCMLTVAVVAGFWSVGAAIGLSAGGGFAAVVGVVLVTLVALVSLLFANALGLSAK